MGLKTETADIDGLRVTVTQFPALYALELSTRTAKAFLPAILSAGGLGADTHVAVLLSNLEPKETRALAIDLLKCASVESDGQIVELKSEAVINRVFSGSLATLLKAAVFAAKVNFADFFGDASQLQNDPAAAASD